MKIDVEKSKIYSHNDSIQDLHMCGALNIDKKGYFSDHPDFSESFKGVLESVIIKPKEYGVGTYFPFKMKCQIDVAEDIFKFFCPEEGAVGTPELRPYKTLDELPFKIGDSVTFRQKDARDKEWVLACVGTVVSGSRLATIHLGAYFFEPDDLLEEYEMFNGKEWVPFGVEA